MSEICRNIGLIFSIIFGVIFLLICLFMASAQYIILIQNWIEDRKKLKKTKDKKYNL